VEEENLAAHIYPSFFKWAKLDLNLSLIPKISSLMTNGLITLKKPTTKLGNPQKCTTENWDPG